MYAIPQWVGWFIAMGILLFLSYIHYLWRERPEELGAVFTVAPTIFGPYMAKLYVENQMQVLFDHIKSPAPDGSDWVLPIHIAFFYSSYLGLFVYVLMRAQRNPEKKPIWIPLTIFSAVFVLISLIGTDFWLYEIIKSTGGDLPDITPLLFRKACSCHKRRHSFNVAAAEWGLVAGGTGSINIAPTGSRHLWSFLPIYIFLRLFPVNACF